MYIDPANTPDDWTLELFISPSSRLFYVCISFISTLIAIAIVIAYFHWREVKEDRIEKKQQELLFTF